MRSPKRRRVWRLKRAGEINANPSVIEQRASTFAAIGTESGPATLVVTRKDMGLNHWAIMPATSRIDSAAIELAKTVAGRIEEVDDAPDLSFAPKVVQLRYRKSDSGIRSTQAGVDLSEVSRTLGDVMPAGSWVATTARSPRMFERGRWSRWLAFRMGMRRPTHHSTARKALVCTVWAGAQDTKDAASILEAVASKLPGFDLEVRTARLSRWPLALGLLTLALAAIAGYVLAGAHELATQGGVNVFVAAAALTGTGGVLTAAGLLPTLQTRVRKGLTSARLPAASALLVPPRRPKKSRADVINPDDEGSEGSYPLHPGAFFLGPHIPASLVAPHSGTMSGESSSASRGVVLPMTRRIGPMIGTAETGQCVYLPARDMAAGVFISGRPASGKSVLARNIAGWSMLERVHPSGLKHFPGQRNTIVYFETKAEAATELLGNAAAIGDRVMPVVLANPTSAAIDLFAVPGTIAERALHFVNAMQYAFADGSIRDESFRTLRIVFTGALGISDDMAREVPGVRLGASPVYYASVLIGAHGDELGVDLAAQVRATAERDRATGREGTDAQLAWESLVLMYGPKVTASARAALQRAPGNKVDQLLSLDHYFAPARPKITWSQVLDNHWAVLVFTGPDTAGNMLESNVSQLMSSLLMFSLRYNIERHCAGWEEQGRAVTIFADELKALAGASPEVIVWLRNQGRSYGVHLVFATQYPEQLSPEVRSAVMSFSMLIAFTQGTAAVAREVVEDFAGDGTEWEVKDVLELPPYHAIVRANVDFRRQPPFGFTSAYFAGNLMELAAAQGYHIATT